MIETPLGPFQNEIDQVIDTAQIAMISIKVMHLYAKDRAGQVQDLIQPVATDFPDERWQIRVRISKNGTEAREVVGTVPPQGIAVFRVGGTRPAVIRSLFVSLERVPLTSKFLAT